MGFGVFLVHPTVVLVLLSASVKRFFVSCMRDCLFKQNNKKISVFFCDETNKKPYQYEVFIFVSHVKVLKTTIVTTRNYSVVKSN